MFFATHPKLPRELTASEALQLIADIAENVGFDRMKFDEATKTMTEDNVITQIYTIAHGHDAGCGCHHLHHDWRAEAAKLFDAISK